MSWLRLVLLSRSSADRSWHTRQAGAQSQTTKAQQQRLSRMPQKLPLLLGLKAHAVSRQADAAARACSSRGQQQRASCRLSQQRRQPRGVIEQLDRGRRACATSAAAAALLQVLLPSGLQQRWLR
jgi:hypothetical protein